MCRSAPALLAFVAAICGCGPSGAHVRAGWKSYEPVGAQYRVQYLNPPWRREASTDTSVTLKVPNNAERFAPDAAMLIPAKYSLVVDVGGSTAKARIEHAEQQLTSSGDTIVVPPRQVTTDYGDAGWELLSDYVGIVGPEHRRIVFLDRAGGGTVSLRFDATPELDDAQIDVMVAGVEVDPGS